MSGGLLCSPWLQASPSGRSPTSWTKRDAPFLLEGTPSLLEKLHSPSQGLMLQSEWPDPFVPKLLLLVLRAANRAHIGQGELRGPTGAWGYRGRLLSLRFQRPLEEGLNLGLATGQVFVEGLCLVSRCQGHPPQIAVAAHLNLHHAVGPQCRRELVKDARERLEGLHKSMIRSSHTARKRSCSSLS